MRVRTGFVSNSSSTSFLIISRKELTEEAFFNLVGVDPSGLLAPIFSTLHEVLLKSVRVKLDLQSPLIAEKYDGFIDENSEDLTENMRRRLDEAMREGVAKVFFGKLSSESDVVEAFFCQYSFELEGEGIYLDGFDDTW